MTYVYDDMTNEEMQQEIIKQNRECNNYEVSETDIICPYCEEVYQVKADMWIGICDPDIYSEGEEYIK